MVTLDRLNQAIDKATELEKTKQQIQSDLDSCRTFLNQTNNSTDGGQTPSPDSSNNNGGTDTPGNSSDVPTTTIPIPIDDNSMSSGAGVGDSPEVVPQESQGVEFLALIFHNIVNWIKKLFKGFTFCV